MTDTGKKKYNIDESLNRIVRSIKGAVNPTDAPDTVSGDLLSIDEAFSELAELFENKLAGETPQVPAGWTVPLAGIANATTAAAGIVELATDAETQTGTDTSRAVTPSNISSRTATQTRTGVAEIATDAEVATGTDTDRIVTPAGLASVLGTGAEYGEIYNNATGTAIVALSTSWQKVTGSFQGNTVSSTNITPDYLNDRITINKNGVYFVALALSFSGSNSATINVSAYVDSVRTESVRFRRKLGTGGDVGSAASIGIINVTGTPVDLEIYAMADSGTPNFKLEAGQIFIHGVG